ncbi:MAG: hypothetical protein AVDCRST_MAG68-3150 [uncultured Gemmatimonadetes bacterium]|uniref:Uncharacterized protein n=1 Tax=uncultured Gemmatimonadota bacterium TaxID=203437 RepID=A0A6J4LV67_9BACT|nr:MAG: hypothetical protein AVDCRST_MAG68-3150 [uncultured Gemmatimonadota bacterium]
MLLDHSHPECTGGWTLHRESGGRAEVSCGTCGAAYPRSAWAEDAGEREHELTRLLVFLEMCGRAILAGRRANAAPRWSRRLNEH